MILDLAPEYRTPNPERTITSPVVACCRAIVADITASPHHHPTCDQATSAATPHPTGTPTRSDHLWSRRT